MKYSLMSLMINDHLKVTKPSFIHRLMATGMGYDGDLDSLDDILAFLNGRGIPMTNGTMTFEDYVIFAKDSGFAGLDVMSFHFEEDGATAAKILEKHGMVMSAINIVAEFVNAVDQEKFDAIFAETTEIMDCAHEAGCRNVLLMPSGYRLDPGVTREQAFWNMVKGLRACVEYGTAKGMVVTTETLESIAVPLGSNGEMLRLFDAVPDLKYTHDSGNPLVAGEDPIATYKLFADRVTMVHFKDLEYTSEKTEMLTHDGRYLRRAHIGQGEIDFAGHLKLLKEVNYDGFIAVEGVIPAEDQLAGSAQALNYLMTIEKRL